MATGNQCDTIRWRRSLPFRHAGDFRPQQLPLHFRHFRRPELQHDLQAAARAAKPGEVNRFLDLRLDLRRSWFLGDILDDVEAGTRAGCRTVLVDVGTEAPPGQPTRQPDFVARDTVHALRIVRAIEQMGPPAELHYLPPSWQPVEHAQLAVSRSQQRAVAG